MQPLYERQMYGEPLALKIERMGTTAVSIANRWALGWPERMKALVSTGMLIDNLQHQANLEQDVLAEETGLKHLSTVEKLQVHGISLEAPMVG